MNTGPAHPDSPARRISVYIDPGCPWTWVTAQWLREAAPHRNLDLGWRPLSLRLRDGDRPPPGAPAQIQALAVAARIQSHRLLRIFEALRAASRDDDIDRLYRRWGERVFAPPWPRAGPGPDVIGEVVTAAGLPASWAACADDPSWDPAIAAAMTAAAAICGPEPASPTIVLDGPPAVGLVGPVFTCAPAGPAALRIIRHHPGAPQQDIPRSSTAAACYLGGLARPWITVMRPAPQARAAGRRRCRSGQDQPPDPAHDAQPGRCRVLPSIANPAPASASKEDTS